MKFGAVYKGVRRSSSTPVNASNPGPGFYCAPSIIDFGHYTVGLTSVRHKGEAQGRGDEIEIVNYCAGIF